MPQEALSQDDIDRLLRDMASGNAPSVTIDADADQKVVKVANPSPRSLGSGSEQPPRRVRNYDFRRPNRISKEYMRGLRLIHEGFTREIPRLWGPLLRAGSQVKIASLEQTIYEEYRNHLAPQSFISTMIMPPLEGEIAFQIDLDPSFIIVDRLLGGPGTGLKHTRELTMLELNILQRLIAALIPAWRESWLPIIHLEPAIGRTLSSTEFLQLTSANESVLVTTLQAHFLGAEIELSICIPYTVIAPVLSRLVTTESTAGYGGNDALEHERLTRHMRQVSLPVAVQLGQAPIPISELSRLAIGDVIRLDVPLDGIATVHIGERAYFTARPGLSNGNMAVQIIDPVLPKG